jgi:hypothetical protein
MQILHHPSPRDIDVQTITMYDITKALDEYREGVSAHEKAVAEQSAIEVLWLTGMIHVEEYFFLKFGGRSLPDGELIYAALIRRNNTWKQPDDFRERVFAPFLIGGKLSLDSQLKNA